MTHSNDERALRFRQAAAIYANDDIDTNLVDALADAMHFCRITGRSFQRALDMAVEHFEAEAAGDVGVDNFKTTERKQP